MHVTSWILFVAFGMYDIDVSFSIDEVFSADGLIAAYGDFNSDQALDMFIISSDWTQLKVYVWNVVKQSFELSSVDYKTNTKEKEEIVSISTADFNGDGCLDVLICLLSPQLKENDLVNVTVYYGDTISLNSGHWSVRMLDQPSVIDVNGDLLPDLFGTNSKGERSYWISVPADTMSSAYFTEDTQFYNVLTTLVKPQSNAFVDVTGDHHADLVLKSFSNDTKLLLFEVWTQDKGKKNLSLCHTMELGLNTFKYIGQMSFADYDSDGIIDVMLPVCLTEDCSHSVLYANTINTAADIQQKKWSVVIDNTFADWQFPLHKMNGSDNIPLTLVTGDYLLDGMIDLVTILQYKESQKLFAANLINIPCSDSKSTGCESTRTFLVQNTMNSISDPISISLMDVYENGILDFLVTCRIGPYYNTKILRNEFVLDAAFLKVAVVGGVCYNDCKCNKGSISHGSHQVGAMTNIKTTNTDGHLMVVNAVQLAQSGYFSLQLPYVIFGLGKSPNFVDEIKIGIPKGDNQYVDRVHEWVAIIPNAQVIVIPYPKDSPSEWMTKLLVGKSKMFLQTGGVLLGTCLLIAGIIIILHVKEKKEDEKEKRKEAHKFHFDAL